MFLSPSRAVGYTFPHNRFYYAMGNTPPCDLFATTPPSARECSILSIGCGDIRSILFSLWLRGDNIPSPTIVMNDFNPSIIARDILLLTLATNAPPPGNSPATQTTFKNYVADLWAIWYSLGLTKLQREKVGNELEGLCVASASNETWLGSKYAKHVSIFDDGTRVAVRQVWSYWKRQNMPLSQALAKQKAAPNRHIVDANFIAERVVDILLPQVQDQKMGIDQACDEVTEFFVKGTTQALGLLEAPLPTTATNPTLFEDSAEFSLHYASFPFEGYHHNHTFTQSNWAHTKRTFPDLCASTTYTQFVPETHFTYHFFLSNCCQQLCLWVANASSLSCSGSRPFNVVFKCGEALAFCDELARKTKGTSPMTFDLIETSNLVDHLSLLPVLLCCRPILKDNGVVCTNSIFYTKFFGSTDSYLSTSIGIPPTLVPSVLGLRCVGYEGSLASDRSKYSHLPHIRGSRESKMLMWSKQPHNTPASSSSLSTDMVDALVNCAKLCILSPPYQREIGARLELTVETFVRVLVSLQETSRITKWDSLCVALMAIPAFRNFLHNMQTLINAHGLAVKILPFTEPGVHCVVPLNWTNTTQFIPSIVISFSDNQPDINPNDFHSIDSLSIEYKDKNPIRLHFLCPNKLFSNSKAVVILKYIEHPFAPSDLFQLNECRSSSPFAPFVSANPTAIEHPSNGITVLSHAEHLDFFDVELSIPKNLASETVTTSSLSAHKIWVKLQKSNISYALQFSTPVNSSLCKTTVSRKGVRVVIRVPKDRYQFTSGPTLYTLFNNPLAYPAYSMNLADNFMASQQFSTLDNKIWNSQLIETLPTWLTLKKIIKMTLEAPKHVFLLASSTLEDLSPKIRGVIIKHGTRHCIMTGGVVADISYCFLEERHVSHVLRIRQCCEEIAPPPQQLIMSFVPAEYETLQSILYSNTSGSPLLSPHPSLVVKGVGQLFTRSFLAPLYTPSLISDNLGPLIDMFGSYNINGGNQLTRTFGYESDIDLVTLKIMQNNTPNYDTNPVLAHMIKEISPILILNPQKTPEFQPRPPIASPPPSLPSPSLIAPSYRSPFLPIPQHYQQRPSSATPTTSTSTTATTNPTHFVCAFCGKSDAKRCLRCLKVAYCNSTCQQRDWPHHRLNCTKKENQIS